MQLRAGPLRAGLVPSAALQRILTSSVMPLRRRVLTMKSRASAWWGPGQRAEEASAGHGVVQPTAAFCGQQPRQAGPGCVTHRQAQDARPVLKC